VHKFHESHSEHLPCVLGTQDSDGSTDEQEELLQAKIQEEHAKFKEQQQRWQAQVRAARPWSAPPLSSPRPESQRIKKNEASELACAPGGSLKGTQTCTHKQVLTFTKLLEHNVTTNTDTQVNATKHATRLW
jgi:hypothetical protein